MMPVKLVSDLEDEILYRLPYRSLARLRSVCKPWNNLILDDIFLKKNFSRMHSYCGEHRFIFSRDEELSSVAIDQEQQNAFQDLTLRRVRPDKPIKVYKVVHCDGLLLCVMDTQLLVWNPLLKETRWVKCSSDFHKFDDAYSLGYVNNCGFRILRFRCPGNSRNKPPRVEVYAFASKAWKVIDITFDWVLRVPLSILSLRGTPFCIGLRGDHKEAFVQSFNFSKERFQPLDHLPFKYKEFNPLALEILKGDRLSVIEQCHKTRKICVWVKHWLMRPSWSRILVVDIPHFPLLYPHLSRSPTNYHVDENNRLVITCIDTDGISINRVIGEKDFQTIFKADVMAIHTFFSCSYVPSLVRLPGFSKQDTSRIRWKTNRFN